MRLKPEECIGIVRLLVILFVFRNSFFLALEQHYSTLSLKPCYNSLNQNSILFFSFNFLAYDNLHHFLQNKSKKWLWEGRLARQAQRACKMRMSVLQTDVVAVAGAWIVVSVDGIVGSDQKSDIFLWMTRTVLFKVHNTSKSDQTTEPIKNKIRLIIKPFSSFATCWARIVRVCLGCKKRLIMCDWQFSSTKIKRRALFWMT